MLGERFTVSNLAYDAVLGAVAGTGGLAAHFMLFQPYFDVYNVMGIKGAAIADWLVGILSLVATYKWLPKTTWKIFGYIIGAGLISLGIVHQFNLIPGLSTGRVSVAPSIIRAPTRIIAPTMTSGGGTVSF